MLPPLLLMAACLMPLSWCAGSPPPVFLMYNILSELTKSVMMTQMHKQELFNGGMSTLGDQLDERGKGRAGNVYYEVEL